MKNCKRKPHGWLSLAQWFALGLLWLGAPVIVRAIDAPHTGGSLCGSCHISHQSLGGDLTSTAGNANSCLSCHQAGGAASAKAFANADQAVPWPGLPTNAPSTGTSHRWDAGAGGHVEFVGGAATPSTGSVLVYGAYTGPYAKTYTLTITTAGAVGTARFNWAATTPGGGSGISVLTAASNTLFQGVYVKFVNGTGTSFQLNDKWNVYVRPDLRTPTNAVVLAHTTNGVPTCSACHDEHSQAMTPFDPAASAYAGGAGTNRHFMRVNNDQHQLCYDCHAPRNVTNSVAGSHPVGITVPVDATHQAPTRLPLEKGTSEMGCLTCHQMHFAAASDADLLRLNQVSLCVDCHTQSDTNTPAAHFVSTNNALLWPGSRFGSLMPARTNLADRGTCDNCHAPHGWPVATNTAVRYPKLLVDYEENICLSCHGTSGPAVKQVQADFADARHHPIGDTEQTPGRGVECKDCHNPHMALTGAHTFTTTATATRNLVSGPLRGVDGVDFNYTGLANFQNVSPARYTYIPRSTGATKEYQICLKCHSGYGYTNSVYTAGTATFTTNTTTITGTGTAWTTNQVGMWISCSNDTASYVIMSVSSATALTVNEPLRTPSQANVPYVIWSLPPGLTPIYAVGTASFTNASASVGGTGTAWNTNMVGAWIYPTNAPSTPYKITAFVSPSNLTIRPAFAGATALGVGYGISYESDQAQEFSPMNLSGHPIVTGLNNYPNSKPNKALGAAQLKAPWNSNPGNQTMMCSDCHNTDATTPAAQGPHGSASQYMLRTFAGGPAPSTWPTTYFTNSWCYNCHNDLSVSMDGHSNHHGAGVCTACHILVPHGGKMSRLLADADGNMPARYALTNTIANSTVKLVSFVKTNGTRYSSGACRANCGNHSSSTSYLMENW